MGSSPAEKFLPSHSNRRQRRHFFRPCSLCLTLSPLTLCPFVDASLRAQLQQPEVLPIERERDYNACPTEIDNYVDTHCFRRDFLPLFWTGYECSVVPFLAEYSKQIHISICTRVTTYTMESGEIVILVLGQRLWFRNRMEKTLINPYQCRSY